MNRGALCKLPLLLCHVLWPKRLIRRIFGRVFLMALVGDGR